MTHRTTQRDLVSEWAPPPKNAFVAGQVELGISDEGEPVISLLDDKGKVRAYGILEFMDNDDAGYEFTGLLMKVVNQQGAAKVLHTYMAERAKHEGVKHSLTVGFYLTALLAGTREFFGVRVDPGEMMPLIEDTQYPEFFAGLVAALSDANQTAPSSSAVH